MEETLHYLSSTNSTFSFSYDATLFSRVILHHPESLPIGRLSHIKPDD
jgi:hypothetical protein